MPNYKYEEIFPFERHWRLNMAEYYLKSYLSKECKGKEPETKKENSQL